MTTLASSLLDFILNLFRDPEAAAAYAEDPAAALADAGLADVDPGDVDALMPMVAADHASAGLAEAALADAAPADADAPVPVVAADAAAAGYGGKDDCEGEKGHGHQPKPVKDDDCDDDKGHGHQPKPVKDDDCDDDHD